MLKTRNINRSTETLDREVPLRSRAASLDLPFDSVSGQPRWFSGPKSVRGMLGKEWNRPPSVSVIASANQSHFVIVAMYPLQKLVVVFDGASGTHDHPNFGMLALRFSLMIQADGLQTWTARFNARLAWEVQKGKKSEEKANGGIVAPNDPVRTASQVTKRF